MSVFGLGNPLGHPLDVDLAELVEGTLDGARAAPVESHLTDCLPCGIKLDRLAGMVPGPLIVDRPLPSPPFLVPTGLGEAQGEAQDEPAVGDLWRAGPGDEHILVVVLAVHGDRALVAPVTFDVEAADEETLVVEAAHSPLGIDLAVHPRLATEVPGAVLGHRLGSFGPDRAQLGGSLSGGRVLGIADASDPRLEVRQQLADRLGSMEEHPPDPGTGSDAPPPRPEHVRSALIGDVRSLRGRACAVRPLSDWGDVLLAHRAGWEPIVTIDEVGVVLVVFGTPHGLVDDADFDAARSVLTRFNGTALVVLASAVSDLAEVFDSSSLNHGIDAPSGRHTPPRPLISGLIPLDAIAKFLDQSTGAKAMAAPTRSPVTRVDVGDILREAASTALADAARQGSRFKIAPKRRGYESVAGDEEPFAAALEGAFEGASVVEGVLHLAPGAKA